MDMQSPSSPSNQKAKVSLFGWWYGISLPPEPPPEASFKQRDMVRRAQLASILLFWFILVLIVVLVIYVIISGIGPVTIGLVVLAALMLGATYLNRKGQVNIAGFIMATGITLVIWGIILSNKGGLAPENLGLFDLLVYPELFAASLLPVNWVFIWALANSAFVISAFTYAPHNQLMGQLLAVSRVSIIERPIQVQILVSVVLWLWVRNATNAIKRADRAEEFSKLQRIVADQMLEKVNQKRQLESEIQQIESVLDHCASGNLDVRLQQQSGNVLWSISGKLNNLLSRFRRNVHEQRQAQQIISQFEKFYMAEQKYRQLVHYLESLSETVRQAQERRLPLQVSYSDTPLDLLLQHMNGKYISEHPLDSHSTASTSFKRTSTSFLREEALQSDTPELRTSPHFPRNIRPTKLDRYSNLEEDRWD